jgi:flavin reductase (NADH)
VSELFREALSRFASGVTVVSARAADEERGMTASAFMSLSLTPPLIALGIARQAKLWPLIEASGAFCVSLLPQGFEAVSQHFAGRPQPEVALRDGRVEGALAALHCRLVGCYPGGDHHLLVGEVTEVRLGEAGPPLVYYQRAYRRLAWPS